MNFTIYSPALVEVTLSADTSILADNDVAADFQEVTDFFANTRGTVTIHSLTLVDEDDQGVDLDILCSRTGGTLGTENSAVSITDANAREVQRVAAIAAADYVDLINSQIATKTNLDVIVNANGSSTSLWIGAVVRSGTPAFTAAGLKLRMYITRH